MYSSTLSLNWALDIVDGPRHAPASLLQVMSPKAWYRWLGELRAVLERGGICRTTPRFDPRTVQPLVCSNKV